MALSFEERIPEINSNLKCLHDFDDVTNADVYDALSSLFDITFVTFTDPRAYGVYLVSEGFGPLFLDLWQQLRKYLKKKKRGSDGHRNLEMLMNVLWNTSCYSPDVADDLVGHGFVSIMLAVINVDGLDKKLLAGPILNILNCMIYRSKNNRSVYRDANAVTILQPLLKSKNVQKQTATLATLAYIVNEKEREILATSKYGLKQLIVLLKTGVKNEDHKAFPEGGIAGLWWSVFDTMDAMNQLAINDTNKAEIERRGAIPAIIRMLKDDFSDDEHRVAVEALWHLSFVESIRNSKILQSTVPMLEKLSKSKSGEVQRVCESALWQIKGSKSENVWPSTSAEKPPPSYKEATTNPGFPTPPPAKVVMLSYQWDHQKRVLKIRERLVNAGLRVWMDVSNMEGDILGAMANAVEESDVILMCMSERYRDSKSCRSEASYAYKLEKKIIPLRLEAEYTPDGWLGFLQGMDLYYACYSDEELDRNMPSLLKVIGGNSPSSGTDAVDGPITPQKHQISQATPPPRPPKQPAATYWSAQEVQNWLVAKKLKCPALDDFEGCDLQELFTSLIRDEEKFKDEIKSDYNMNGPTCTRFTAGLRQLFQQ